VSRSILLGTHTSERLDLDIILRSNLLVQAASGGGKSWAIRRIVEQSFKHVPIIIIDPEGEFGTLREKFDFVLAGPGGDTPVDVRSAALLARRVLELRTSIICDTFELPKRLKPIWAKAFIDALIDAPKNLWTDFLIVIDEAHELCPESGRGAKTECVATDSVVDLCAKGRKRGYGTILATQRLGKLRKDAAAECKNLLIGQTFIDIDRDRAADSLGILRGQRDTFFHDVKILEPGTFFGLGRGISHEPKRLFVGDVTTTHPEPGSKRATKLPPPTTKILHLLPQLKDLPAEAEKKNQTEAELRQTIRKLEADLKTRPTSERTVQIKIPMVPRELRDTLASIKRHVARIEDQARVAFVNVELAITQATPEQVAASVPKQKTVQAILVPRAPLIPREPREPNGDLGAGPRRMLQALAATHSRGLTRRQVATMAKIKPTTGTFRNYLSELRVGGYISEEGDLMIITDSGRAIVGDVAVPQTRDELLNQWRPRLGGTPFKMLEHVLANDHVSNISLAEAVGINFTTGSFRNYISILVTNGLVDRQGPGFYKPSAVWSEVT
jgi:hypothetical protein